MPSDHNSLEKQKRKGNRVTCVNRERATLMLTGRYIVSGPTNITRNHVNDMFQKQGAG